MAAAKQHIKDTVEKAIKKKDPSKLFDLVDLTKYIVLGGGAVDETPRWGSTWAVRAPSRFWEIGRAAASHATDGR